MIGSYFYKLLNNEYHYEQIHTTVCFSLFVGIQNFVSKPLFYSVIENKNIADPLIHLVSFLVLLSSYYLLFRWYEKREIKELSIEVEKMLNSLIKKLEE